MSGSRVLMIVSNGFTHDQRVANEARSLAGAGYLVTVLAWDRKAQLPFSETREGIRIVRLRNTLGMRLRPFELFRLRPFWRLASSRALQLHHEAPLAVVHCHDLDTLPAGVAVGSRTGIPVIYDAHEFFPEMIGELSRAKLWRNRFAKLERRLVPRCALLLVASPLQREYFSAMTKSPIVTVMNTRPRAYARYEPPSNPRMRIVYFGGLHANRLLLTLGELAVEDDSFEVEIGGWGPAEGSIRELAAKSRGNLRFLGIVPTGEVVPRTRAADLVYSLLDPTKRVFRLAAPNKLFEALVAGRPLLASKGTWVGDEVVAGDCGLAIEYSKDALRSAIRTLRDDPATRERMGRNAFRLAAEKYDWEKDRAALLDAYGRVIGAASS